MKRVLQLNAGTKDFGGVSVFLYTLYKNFNYKEYCFHFLTPQFSTYQYWEHEIKQMGGELFEFKLEGSSLKINLLYAYKLSRYLLNNSYDVIHINSGVIGFNFISIIVSKLFSCSKIIVHSHSAKSSKQDFIHKLAKYLISVYSDERLACSYDAAEYMFCKKYNKDKNYIIIPNGIEINNFLYDANIRKIEREKYGLMNMYVIGHVGRFVDVKNHEFLIEIYHQVHEKNSATKLVLVGDGELKSSIEKKVHELGLTNDVLFLGNRKDVHKIYQIMDLFVLPSKYEGLGIVNIEAQVAGLPVIVSDTVPKEVNISNTMKFLALNDKESWVQSILHIQLNQNRKDLYNQICNNTYDIKQVSKEIEQIYRRLLT